MNEIIYRIQDKNGRGPFRPGFSIRWSDLDGEDRLPTFMEEFHDLKYEPGFHYGTGVRTLHEIDRWFTHTEQARLCLLGFRVVSMEVDKIVAESNNQVVFARAQPLKYGAHISLWPRQVIRGMTV